MSKDIVLIYVLLPPPSSPNKDIKNKENLVSFLTPSLLPNIRTYEPFVFCFKKPDFAFLSHNFYGVGKFKNKLVKFKYFIFREKTLKFVQETTYNWGKN